jgi:hypothetical protein
MHSLITSVCAIALSCWMQPSENLHNCLSRSILHQLWISVLDLRIPLFTFFSNQLQNWILCGAL